MSSTPTPPNRNEKVPSPEYAFGYYWGWRGFRIGRDGAEGSQWRLASPQAPIVLEDLNDVSAFMPMYSEVPATCPVYKENTAMRDVLLDMANDVNSLLYGNPVLTAQFRKSFPGVFSIIDDSHTTAPDRECSCGYYTFKDIDGMLAEYSMDTFDAIGIVKVSGKIQRYSAGYRSQFIKPHKIFVCSEALRPSFRMSEKRRLRILEEAVDDIRTFYECHVEIVKPPFIPDVLDAYMDPSIYPPAVQMPLAEIPKEYLDGQDR